MNRALPGILCLAVIFAFACPSASAKKKYHLSDHDVEIHVLESGDLRVVETLRYSFDEGTFTYAYREIPVRRFDRIEFVSLRSPDGPVTIDEIRIREGWSRRLDLRWSFPATDASRTFRIEYIAHGVLRSRGEHQILDWAAVGKRWKVPVSDVDVTVHLPWAFDSEIRTRPASTTTVTDGATQVTFRRDRVGRRDGWRVVVEFSARASLESGVEPDDRRNPMLTLLPGFGAVFVLLSGLWWRVGRVEPTGTPTRVASRPDPDLSIAEAACLAHRGSRVRRSVMAVVFDLARRGVLKIEARVKKGAFGTRSIEVSGHPLDRTHDLAAWESRTVKELEADPRLKKFGERTRKINKIVKDLEQGLRERGMISKEREALRSRWLAGSGLLAALATGFILLVFVNVWRELLPWALLSVAAGWGAVIMSASIEVRTPRAMGLAASLRNYGRGQREEIENQLPADPSRAVSRIVELLPELALDEKIDRRWFKKIKGKIRDRPVAFALPAWMEVLDGSGNPVEAAAAAATAFEAFCETAGSVAAYAGGGAAGGGGGGAGGGGGGAG